MFCIVIVFLILVQDSSNFSFITKANTFQSAIYNNYHRLWLQPFNGKLNNVSVISINELDFNFKNQPSSMLESLWSGNNLKTTSVVETILSNTKDERHKTQSDFIKLMKKLVAKKIILTSSDRAQLAKRLLKEIPSMSSGNLATIIWSLGCLKLSVRNPEMLRVYDSILERLTYHRNTISGADTCLSFDGLARIGIKCNSKSLELFLTALPRSIQVMDSFQLSNSLWAMGKIGIQWDSLPLKTQKAIGLAIVRTCSSMTAMCVANSIHGLSNQKAKWNSLPSYLKSALINGLQHTISKMNEKETSNCISGLGRLGVNWFTDLPPTIRELLGEAFLRSMDDLGAKGLAQSVNGLGRMNAGIGSLPLKFRYNILNAIIDISTIVDAKQVSNILFGLGRMGANILIASNSNSTNQNEHLPNNSFSISSDTYNSLMIAFVRESWYINAEGLSYSLLGLSLMRAKWDYFRKDEKQAILSSLNREVIHMSEEHLTYIFYSLGELGVNWKSCIPHETKLFLLHSFEEKVTQLSSDHLLIIMAGISKLKINWYQISLPLQNKIFEAISNHLRQSNERVLRLFLVSLAAVGMKWNQLGPLLQTSIDESIARCQFETKLMIVSNNNTSNNLKNNHHQMINSNENHFQHNYQLHDINDMHLTDKLISTSHLSQLSSKTAAQYLLSIESGFINYFDTSLQDDSINMIDIETNQVNNNNNNKDKDNMINSLKSNNTTIDEENISNMSSKVKSSMKQSVELVDTSGQYYILNLLANIDVKWMNLGFSAKSYLINNLISNLPIRSETYLIQSLESLSTLGMMWDEINSDLRNAIFKSLILCTELMNGKEISVTILSLSKMGVCYAEDLPENVKASLRVAIARQSKLNEFALSSLLVGLGKLSRTWDSLHPEVRISLKAAIVLCHLNDKCTPNGVANILKGLALLKVEWNHLSSSVRLALIKEISKTLPFTTESQLCSMISSMGSMRVNFKNLPVTSQDQIATQIYQSLSTINESNLSLIIYAFSEMNIENWYDLPSKLQSGFSNALIRVCNNTLESSMQNTFNINSNNNNITIPEYNYNMNNNIKKFKTQLNEKQDVQRLEKIKSPLSPKSIRIIETVVAAARNRTRKEIKNNPIDTSPRITTISLVQIIVSLGRMRLPWAMLSSSFTIALESAIFSLISNMNNIQIADIMVGLSRMGWRIENMKIDQKKQLMFSIVNIVMTPKNNNSTKVNNNANKNNNNEIKYINDKFDSKSDLAAIGSVISSLGLMGLRWTSLSHPMFNNQSSLRSKYTFIRTFHRAIAAVLQDGSKKAVADVILGMGLLELTWETSMPKWLKKEVSSSIIRLYNTSTSDEKENNNCVNKHPQSFLSQSFMSAHPSLSSKRSKLTQDCDCEFDSYALSCTMYGLSLLVFDSPYYTSTTSTSSTGSMQILDKNNDDVERQLLSAHIALLNNVCQQGGVGIFSDKERERILIYMHLIQQYTVPDLSTYAQNKQEACHILRADSPEENDTNKKYYGINLTKMTSDLQKLLTCRNDDLLVMNKYSSFGGVLPITTTVFADNKPVAFLEINTNNEDRFGLKGEEGMNGTIASGKFNIRRQDLMKETLYRRKFPDATFTRVDYNQFNRLGSDYITRKFADYVTLSMFNPTQQISVSNYNLGGPSKGWVKRRAEMVLQNALKKVPTQSSYLSKEHHSFVNKTTSENAAGEGIFDFIFADYEEDNS
eukprot:gene5273-7325_t